MEVGTRVSLALGNGRTDPGVVVRATRDMLPLPAGFVAVHLYTDEHPRPVYASGLTVMQDARSARNEIRRRRRVERAWRVA